MRSLTTMTSAVMLAAVADAGAMPAKAKTNGKPKPVVKAAMPNIYLDAQNEATSSVEKARDGYIARFELMFPDSTLVLDEGQIDAIVASVIGDESKENDVDDPESVAAKRLRAMAHANGRETLEDLTTPPSISTPLGALAVEIGNAIGHEADTFLDEAALKKRQYDGAPLQIVEEYLFDAFDGKRSKKGKLLRCDKIADLPIIGSKEGGKTQPAAVPAGYNGPWDKYKFTDQEGKERSGWFIRDVHNTLPTGAKLVQRAKWLTLLKADANSTSVPADIRAEYGTDSEKLENERKSVATQIGNRINRLSRAFAFIQQVTRFNDMLPGIGWYYSTEDKDALYVSTKPFKLTYSEEPVKTVGPYSLTQFLAFKVKVAKDNGATIDNIAPLTATLNRKAKTPGATPINLLPDASGIVTSMHRIEEAMTTSGNTVRADMLSALNRRDKEGDEALLHFGRGMGWLNAVFAHFVKRYDALEVAEADKGEDAAGKVAAKG